LLLTLRNRLPFGLGRLLMRVGCPSTQLGQLTVTDPARLRPRRRGGLWCRTGDR